MEVVRISEVKAEVIEILGLVRFVIVEAVVSNKER